MQDAKSPDYNQQFDMFNKLYQALMSSIVAVPFPVEYRAYISQNLGQGFMWAREAFGAMMHQQAQKPQESKPEEPATEELLPSESVAAPDAVNDH